MGPNVHVIQLSVVKQTRFVSIAFVLLGRWTWYVLGGQFICCFQPLTIIVKFKRRACYARPDPLSKSSFILGTREGGTQRIGNALLLLSGDYAWRKRWLFDKVVISEIGMYGQQFLSKLCVFCQFFAWCSACVTAGVSVTLILIMVQLFVTVSATTSISTTSWSALIIKSTSRTD